MLTRERRPMRAAALLPSAAPLPSLSSALARRAAIFGPQQLDADGFLELAPEVAPLGRWRTLGQAARGAVATLADRRGPAPAVR